MVLAELGNRLTSAIRKVSEEPIISEATVDALLKDIGNALVLADVNVPLVAKLKANIKKQIRLEDIASGLNKRKIIKQAVFDNLIALLDPGVKPYKPVSGKSNVFMFVGLQGCGKTTTVVKLAHNYKTALVGADTFRAGAMAQLSQMAMKAKIPHHVDYVESDPVVVAQNGVEMFRKEGFEIIIVDTSGRNKQEEDLFEEMQRISNTVRPDNVIFAMDSAMGQAAYEQAMAFKAKVQVGAVVITKMDGHAKGGGALSAVAATQSPIIFFGTGENIPDLEAFNPKSFVSRLLGMGDIDGLTKMLEEAMPTDSQAKLGTKLKQGGKFSLRDMYEQLQNVMKMGPLDKVMQMIPGMNNMPQLPQGSDGNAKLKAFITIMDSMTDQELDSTKGLIDASRMLRIARGSGRRLEEVKELMVQYKNMANIFANGKNPRNMANMIPPHLLKQMGGPNVIRQLNSGKMPAGLNLQNMFG